MSAQEWCSKTLPRHPVLPGHTCQCDTEWNPRTDLEWFSAVDELAVLTGLPRDSIRDDILKPLGHQAGDPVTIRTLTAYPGKRMMTTVTVRVAPLDADYTEGETYYRINHTTDIRHA